MLNALVGGWHVIPDDSMVVYVAANPLLPFGPVPLPFPLGQIATILEHPTDKPIIYMFVEMSRFSVLERTMYCAPIEGSSGMLRSA